jgi:uncharacterized protein YndB with AHSA1/START domain
MKKPLIVKNSIIIDAPAARVWDALVNPEKTKQYMYGCETVSDWQKGSQLSWKGVHEGKEMIFVQGSILDIQPGKLLTYTAMDPHSPIDDSANPITVTYALTEETGKTHFTVTQGDYALVAEGERRYAESYNNGEGWNPLLVQIKSLVETNG